MRGSLTDNTSAAWDTFEGNKFSFWIPRSPADDEVQMELVFFTEAATMEAVH